MKITTVSRKIEIDASADFWELYHTPGRDLAAASINNAIVDACAYRSTRKDVSKAALMMMEKFREFGAMDSEGFRALEEILDQIFGSDE